MRLEDSSGFYEKAKQFFKLNWWLLWIGYVFILIFIVITAIQMQSDNERIKNLLEREVRGVVFVGQNGQVMFSEKTLIDAGSDSRLKSVIKNNLVNNLILDASKISNNYKIKINNPDDIYSNYKKVRNFYQNFIPFKNPKYPKAVNYFRTMLNGYVQSINKRNLPEQIVPEDSLIATYNWNDESQTFFIVVNVKASVFVYNIAKNAFDNKEATIQIRAKGYFDIMESTTENPLGIKYFEVGITNAKNS